MASLESTTLGDQFETITIKNPLETQLKLLLDEFDSGLKLQCLSIDIAAATPVDATFIDSAKEWRTRARQLLALVRGWTEVSVKSGVVIADDGSADNVDKAIYMVDALEEKWATHSLQQSAMQMPGESFFATANPHKSGDGRNVDEDQRRRRDDDETRAGASTDLQLESERENENEGGDTAGGRGRGRGHGRGRGRSRGLGRGTVRAVGRTRDRGRGRGSSRVEVGESQPDLVDVAAAPPDVEMANDTEPLELHASSVTVPTLASYTPSILNDPDAEETAVGIAMMERAAHIISLGLGRDMETHNRAAQVARDMHDGWMTFAEGFKSVSRYMDAGRR